MPLDLALSAYMYIHTVYIIPLGVMYLSTKKHFERAVLRRFMLINIYNCFNMKQIQCFDYSKFTGAQSATKEI